MIFVEALISTEVTRKLPSKTVKMSEITTGLQRVKEKRTKNSSK